MTTPKLRMTSLESEIGDLIDYYFMFEVLTVANQRDQ